MTLIRRVPLDFDWPLTKTWEGFVLPQGLRLPPCPDCRHDDGRATGFSAGAWALHESWYALDVPDDAREAYAWHDKITQWEVDLLAKAGRLDHWVPLAGGSGIGHVWTAGEVNKIQRQNAAGGGHDALNRWRLVKHRCKRLRISVDCETCSGSTNVGSAGQRAAVKAWKPYGPPTGSGWQVWEDIGEGSPVSPVFGTRADLVGWLTSPAGCYGRRTPLAEMEADALIDTGSSVGTFTGVATTMATPSVLAPC